MVGRSLQRRDVEVDAHGDTSATEGLLKEEIEIASVFIYNKLSGNGWVQQDWGLNPHHDWLHPFLRRLLAKHNTSPRAAEVWAADKEAWVYLPQQVTELQDIPPTKEKQRHKLCWLLGRPEIVDAFTETGILEAQERKWNK